LLTGLGRAADAERLWREAIADGVENSRSGLAGFLRSQGRIDEAIAFLSEVIEAGEDPYAWKWLADLYEQQGRIEEAVNARWKAIATGEDINAWNSFCHLLESNGLADDAISFARSAFEDGAPEAAEFLAGMLSRASRTDEAVAVLRTAITSGDPWASGHLSALLREQGKIEEAEQVLRRAVAGGDPYAGHHLALFLHMEGRTDEAIETWWITIDTGDSSETSNTARHFVDAMLRTGRSEMAEQVWRRQLAAGDYTARGWLVDLLERQGRLDEARALRTTGLTPDDFRGLDRQPNPASRP